MKNESEQARAAYEYYASLPPGERTLARVARDKEIPERTVQSWAQRYHWASRSPLTKAQRWQQLRERAERELEKNPNAKDAQAWLDVIERVDEFSKESDAEQELDASRWTEVQLDIFTVLYYVQAGKLPQMTNAEFVAVLNAGPEALRAKAHEAYR